MEKIPINAVSMSLSLLYPSKIGGKKSLVSKELTLAIMHSH